MASSTGAASGSASLSQHRRNLTNTPVPTPTKGKVAASGSAALSPHRRNLTNTSVRTPTKGKGHKITNDEELRIVLVGKTGVGKSATGNTILGKEGFLSRLSAMSLTVDCKKRRGVVDGQKVAVIDTPGLFDTRFDKEKTFQDISQCITYASPGPHVFLVIIKLGRYTDEEMKTVQNIQEIFGPAADKYSMVLFTGGDSLDDGEKTIHEFVKESPELKKLVGRCNGQYHVFNNKREDPSQVTELLKKIRSIALKNGGSHYTNGMFQEAEKILEQQKERILKEREEEVIKEKEELKKEIEGKMQKEIDRINAKHQFERARERREREERKREEQRRNEERKREMKEREKLESQIQKMNEQLKRERKEKAQLLKRELQMMKGQLQCMREKEESEKQRMERERSEWEKREAKKEKERKELEEKTKKEYEKKLENEKDKIQTSHEAKARKEAEDSDPFFGALKTLSAGIIDAGQGVFQGLGKAICNWFKS